MSYSLYVVLTREQDFKGLSIHHYIFDFCLTCMSYNRIKQISNQKLLSDNKKLLMIS